MDLDLTTFTLKKTCCAFGDVDLFRSINGLQNEPKTRPSALGKSDPFCGPSNP